MADDDEIEVSMGVLKIDPDTGEISVVGGDSPSPRVMKLIAEKLKGDLSTPALMAAFVHKQTRAMMECCALVYERWCCLEHMGAPIQEKVGRAIREFIEAADDEIATDALLKHAVLLSRDTTQAMFDKTPCKCSK